MSSLSSYITSSLLNISELDIDLDPIKSYNKIKMNEVITNHELKKQDSITNYYNREINETNNVNPLEIPISNKLLDISFEDCNISDINMDNITSVKTDIIKDNKDYNTISNSYNFNSSNFNISNIPPNQPTSLFSTSSNLSSISLHSNIISNKATTQFSNYNNINKNVFYDSSDFNINPITLKNITSSNNSLTNKVNIDENSKMKEYLLLQSELKSSIDYKIKNTKTIESNNQMQKDLKSNVQSYNTLNTDNLDDPLSLVDLNDSGPIFDSNPPSMDVSKLYFSPNSSGYNIKNNMVLDTSITDISFSSRISPSQIFNMPSNNDPQTPQYQDESFGLSMATDDVLPLAIAAVKMGANFNNVFSKSENLFTQSESATSSIPITKNKTDLDLSTEIKNLELEEQEYEHSIKSKLNGKTEKSLFSSGPSSMRDIINSTKEYLNNLNSVTASQPILSTPVLPKLETISISIPTVLPPPILNNTFAANTESKIDLKQVEKSPTLVKNEADLIYTRSDLSDRFEGISKALDQFNEKALLDSKKNSKSGDVNVINKLVDDFSVTNALFNKKVEESKSEILTTSTNNSNNLSMPSIPFMKFRPISIDFDSILKSLNDNSSIASNNSSNYSKSNTTEHQFDYNKFMNTAVKTEEILANGANDIKQQSLRNKASMLNSLKSLADSEFSNKSEISTSFPTLKPISTPTILNRNNVKLDNEIDNLLSNINSLVSSRTSESKSGNYNQHTSLSSNSAKTTNQPSNQFSESDLMIKMRNLREIDELHKHNIGALLSNATGNNKISSSVEQTNEKKSPISNPGVNKSDTSINNFSYEVENTEDDDSEIDGLEFIKKPKFKVLKTIANTKTKPEKVRLHQALQHHKFVSCFSRSIFCRVVKIVQSRMADKFAMNPHVLEFQCKTGAMQSKVLTFLNKSSDRSDDLEFEIISNNIFKFSQTKGYIRAGCSLNLFVTYSPISSGYQYSDCSIIVKFVLPLAKAIPGTNTNYHDFEDLELHLKDEINKDQDADIFKSKFIDQDDESLYQIETSMFICGLALDNDAFVNKSTSLLGKEPLKIKHHSSSRYESSAIKQITEQFIERMELDKKERANKENEMREKQGRELASANQPINVNVSTPFNITLNSQPFKSIPNCEQAPQYQSSNSVQATIQCVPSNELLFLPTMLYTNRMLDLKVINHDRQYSHVSISDGIFLHLYHFSNLVAPPFYINSNSLNIPPNKSEILRIKFQPSVEGKYEQIIRLNYSDKATKIKLKAYAI